MPDITIPSSFYRSAYTDPDEAAASARFLVPHVCNVLHVPDLGDIELLDVGCGTKFVEALINDGLPIKKYVGVDVYGEMIAFLGREVADDRFQFAHFDVRNELYNPGAQPMTAESDLGIGDQTFDLIWLFSVFTHLNPTDFGIMLQILRRYIRPQGKLFFTAFLQERTNSGHGAMEGIGKAIEQALIRGDELPAELVEQLKQDPRPFPDFVDMIPEKPLRVAMYSREYAYSLIEGTGWVVEQLLEPNQYAQHQFVCSPS